MSKIIFPIFLYINFIKIIFQIGVKVVREHNAWFELGKKDFQNLKVFFEKNKNVFEKYLENPVLSEHDIFVNLLWSIFNI